MDVLAESFDLPPELWWVPHGACRGMFSADRDIWFSDDRQDQAEAIAVCEGCTVRQSCGNYAIGQPRRDDAGIWGGLTASKRDAIRSGKAEPPWRAVPARTTCERCGDRPTSKGTCGVCRRDGRTAA